MNIGMSLMNILATYDCVYEHVYGCVYACFLKYKLQIADAGPNQLQQSFSNVLEVFLVGTTNTKSYESRMVPRPLFVSCKGIFLFSIANTSSTIDFQGQQWMKA
jgi:hypothetical protein